MNKPTKKPYFSYKIKKGAPPPPPVKTGRPGKYPLYELQVGDMVELTGVSKSTAAWSACYFARINPPKKFAVRTLPNGNIGIWRVK